MITDFHEQFLQRKNWFDQQVDVYLRENQWPDSAFVEDLQKSFAYSLKQGGKRFRPVIASLVGEAFGIPPKKILPWALAVEMIHTYSLIHDDLPCMDNDDLRRGEPTNHKIFGESTALLAGDVLQSEAFQLIAERFSNEPNIGLELTRILARAIGIRGMVSGQAIDMSAKDQKLSRKDLFLMHALKTGALIRAAVEGAAVICTLNADKREMCQEYGAHLGLAFQLKDDILDHEEDKIENGDFKHMLIEVSDQAKAILNNLGMNRGLLFDVIDYNMERKN